jgi:RNA polymerase sigma factor (sigma-70 family)
MSNRTLGGFIRTMGGTLVARGDAGLSDAQLLERIRTGSEDAAAFEALVRRHGPMVLGVCRRLLGESADADDAFQATFMVFVRRARSLQRPERLAGWLYQVAYRTARQARARSACQRAREQSLVDVPAPEPVAELVWRDLRPVFDAELNRLPEHYRLPVVLCFLEGRSKRDVARTLGWAEGTLSSRLQRARELLRGRLARRGLPLSAGLLPLALFEGSAGAAVPQVLLTSTIHAAWSGVGAVLPGPAAALAEGVIQSMFVSKLKAMGAALVAVAALGGGAGLVAHSSGMGGSALAAPPQHGDAPTRATATTFVGVAGGPAMVIDTSESIASDLAKVTERLAQARAETIRLIADEGADDLRKAEVQLQQLDADLTALKEQTEQLRRKYQYAAQKRKAEQEQIFSFYLGLFDTPPAEEERQLQKEIDRLQSFLRERQQRLVELREKRDLNRQKADPEREELRLKSAALETQVAAVREQLSWAERMAAKGFLAQREVEAEKAKLAAKEKELAEWKTAYANYIKRLEGLPEEQRLEQVVKEKAELFEVMQRAYKQGAASQVDADHARVALAEARVARAQAEIRRELQAIVEVRDHELLRAAKLYEAGALAAADYQKARLAAEQARKRLGEAK